MGSPDFAVPTLRALHAAGHRIVAVYCQPPRPAGRGQAVQACPVQRAAEALGLPVRFPASLKRDATAQAAFAELDLDVAVVAAYGLILPPLVLAAPLLGCVNVHASLLPRWRGAGPIQAAILAGDSESGVTIMRMEAGLDTGPILLQGRVPITPQTTAGTLHDELAALGAALVLRALDTQPAAVTQPDEGVTYAPKLTRADGLLDWTRDARELDRQVRALNPWPGTFTTLAGETLKVLAVAVADADSAAGETLDDALLIACGAGALRLLRVQAPGRAAMDAPAFLRGRPVGSGTRLG